MTRTDTLPACLAARAAQTPKQAAYWSRDDTSAQWHSVDWQTVHQRVRRLAGHLRELGVQQGDTVVIAMPTTVEWEYCHQAALAAGGVVVGVDAHDTDSNIRHIFATVRPTTLMLASGALAARLVPLLDAPPPRVIVAQGPAGDDNLSLAALLDRDASDAPLPPVRPDHPATIIFTSGSSGRPKGVEYSHGQLCLVGHAILERFPTIHAGAHLACWLPLSNLFQRIINLCGMLRGAETWFVDNPATIIGRLPEIQPTLFIGVPRFYEKLHAGLLAELDKHPWPLRRIALGAWVIGCRFRQCERSGTPPGHMLAWLHPIADRLVLARIRSLMGPRLQFMVSGSAPIPLWLLERFHGLGWRVLEAYGASENALPIALNTLDACRFGSVGRPLPQNTVRLGDDGEVLVKGPAVFSGYLGEKPDRGAGTALDPDGFLHTGDLGHLDADGFLWLTGRKSEVFKTSTGRKIAPVPVEACLKQLPFVEHVVLFGRDRPFSVALLVLDTSALDDRTDADGAIAASVLDTIGNAVSGVCAALPDHQRPAGVVVTRRPFSIDGGELTANLKLRRTAIESGYRDTIAALYHELASRPAAAPSTCKVIEAR